ncbi:MAG: hypothetical protein K9J85_01250 [Desulfobacteraceae bacterium]|nr:hypothetical protein [Desulfobacteraceae bacterium]
MIIIPREKPVVQELNSYYLDIDKLIEHYQGELSAGVVYFRSQGAEAVLFFDEQSLANGYIEDRRQQLQDKEAIDTIIEMARGNNFAVSVYRIAPERLYFWANLPNSRPLYKDLTSEFTDLEGLIKKMEGEKLTGFIDVELSNGEGGLLFFYKGQVIGGSSEDRGGDVDRSTQYRDDLIRRSKEHGGRFNVSKVFMEPEESVAAGGDNKSGTAGKEPGSGEAARSEKQISRERVLEMLQALLGALESLVRKNRRIRSDFETLLNRKFVEKADKFDFLDPFLAEFRYSGGRISYKGEAGPKELVGAIEECAYEIAHENSLLSQLRSTLDDWRRRFADEIDEFDVKL